MNLGCLPPPDDEHRRKYPLALAARPQQVGPMVIGTEMFESFAEPVQRDGAWWIGLDIKNLGCLPPPDDEHRRKYPLKAALIGTVQVGPMVIGTEMFESFAEPVQKDGAWWIGLDIKNLGRSMGGHAMCLLPGGWKDIRNGWQQFDQGQTSACVGFSSSRMQSLYNRTLYDGATLYRECKKRDGIPNQDGTYVRVAFDVLREKGPWRRSPAGRVTGPLLAHGILENRWTTDIDEAAQWLNLSGEYATILNSWGTSYPREVRIPLETLAWLSAQEDRYLELAAVTDRPGPSPTT